MGSLDGAEICELVALFILNQLIQANIGLTRETVGLYRDDGLCVTKISTTEEVEDLKDKIREVFKREGLDMETVSTKKCQLLRRDDALANR